MPVTTRTITVLVGNPYKPLFATVTGCGEIPDIVNNHVDHILYQPIVSCSDQLLYPRNTFSPVFGYSIKPSKFNTTWANFSDLSRGNEVRCAI